MLPFGGVSSAGIYDDMAKLIKELAIQDSNIDPELLDDCVACAQEGAGIVPRFYESYRQIASEINVKLADESDPDKAFKATHIGKVLGISYDLKKWRWWLSKDKLIPILYELNKVCTEEWVTNGQIASLNGKINHYHLLVTGGLWQRGFLISMEDSRQSPNTKVPVSQMAKDQAKWWIDHLRVAALESTIPDPRPMLSMKRVKIYPDAAGGTANKLKNGVGCFSPPHDWCYMPWSPIIRENRKNTNGVRFAHKLACLEGFGALLGLVTIPDRARNSSVEILVDNAGFVGVYQVKHHCSSCPYTLYIHHWKGSI